MIELRPVDRVEGTAIPLRGNNIDTDRIIPARFLKALTFDGLGEHVFEDDRASMPEHPFANPAYAGASILLVNENFGSGSSREHAPQALRRWGVDACIGQSFSEIFLGNATAIGLPCATAPAPDIEELMTIAEGDPGTPMAMSVGALSVTAAGRTIALDIPPLLRDSLLTGQWDATGLLLGEFEDVRRVASRLPYVRGF
ncbi:MAG: 3-isopropylmalate dehydratase small subunit [Gemmatimonadetes bacterium]|nr:3-isopropylmalate dehydratase small subunit [Gemmatimonadota bacterium]MYE69255.1 3-isopropylmalate dehydratase small subunit [Gemmatimonadota bacterium]MYJ69703.1 3-isopropylmalate dehydratase small subunit [Gemmatimonadota bacterium]